MYFVNSTRETSNILVGFDDLAIDSEFKRVTVFFFTGEKCGWGLYGNLRRYDNRIRPLRNLKIEDDHEDNGYPYINN